MALILFISVLPYIWILGGGLDQLRAPPVEVFTVLMTTCFAYHGLFIWSVAKRGYSLLSVTIFFFWVFCGFSPLMCSLSGRWLWGDITFEMSGYILYASLLCFLFMLFFFLAYSFSFQREWGLRALLRGRVADEFHVNFGTFSSLFIGGLLVALLGVSGILFRTGSSFTSEGFIGVIVQNFLRPMTLLIGVSLAWLYLGTRRVEMRFRSLLIFLLLVFGLAMNFPLSVARFYGFMVVGVFFYFGILRWSLLRAHWVAAMFLVVGFMGSFAADATRYARQLVEIGDVRSMQSSFSVDSFYLGHTDAFEVLVYGLEFSDTRGVTMGDQLLGVLFFWVPRTYWPTKAVATGSLLGATHIKLLSQTENVNLSAPLVLEGYINFGLVGVVLFGAITGLVAGMIDRAVVVRRRTVFAPGNPHFVACIDMVGAPLLGLWLFVLRGSLLVAFAYTVGIIASGYFVWVFFLRRMFEPSVHRPILLGKQRALGGRSH